MRLGCHRAHLGFRHIGDWRSCNLKTETLKNKAEPTLGTCRHRDKEKLLAALGTCLCTPTLLRMLSHGAHHAWAVGAAFNPLVLLHDGPRVWHIRTITFARVLTRAPLTLFNLLNSDCSLFYNTTVYVLCKDLLLLSASIYIF